MRGSVALPCSPLRALHARADGDLRTLRAPSARTASLHQGELCWRLGRPGGQAGGGRAGGAADGHRQHGPRGARRALLRWRRRLPARRPAQRVLPLQERGLVCEGGTYRCKVCGGFKPSRATRCVRTATPSGSGLPRTMATASLRTDSPKTIEKRSTLTPSCWKTASTVTGSVAEMSEPNVSDASIPSG